MEHKNNIEITIETTVNVTIEKVWEYWTEPKHIVKWNYASEDWHTPISENDFRVGGKFLSRMEALDGSFGFDFSGVYDEIKIYETISYILDDDRKVKISFIKQDNSTRIIETFEAEDTNPVEMQQGGWQLILDHFKGYIENATN